MRLPVATAVLLCTAWAANAAGQGVLEIPDPNSTQSGIGVISGWHCSAERIEIVIDGGAPVLAASHTQRGDTSSVCSRTDTGFSLLWNWNLLPTHCFGCRYHRIVALADGIQFADTEFQAENFGTEFLTGKTGRYGLANFPGIGAMTWVEWDETRQNFSVYFTASDQFSVSGTYYGALESGAHAPYCGPWPPDRKLPIRYGSFSVQVTGEHMALTIQYADGQTCSLPGVALEPHDGTLDIDGYVRAVFDRAAAAQCPEFPEGVSVQANGQRMVANSRDNCVTAAVWGAK
ncbi:MAG: hypothetical protein U1F58_04370 [Burkholderiales bacterium]